MKCGHSFVGKQLQKFEKSHSGFDLWKRSVKLGAMLEIPIHVIDFEGSRRSGIVEYGVVTLVKGRVAEARTRLCAPTGAMHAREIQQHGIRKDSVTTARPFSEEWDYFSELRASGPLCAHNAAYEAALLSDVWTCPRLSPDFSQIESGARLADWGPWLDTLLIYRRLYPDLERHNLADLIAIFEQGEQLEAFAQAYCPAGRRRYHSALYDALASACLLLHLLDEPALKGCTLPWLFQQSAPSRSAHEALIQTEFPDDA